MPGSYYRRTAAVSRSLRAPTATTRHIANLSSGNLAGSRATPPLFRRIPRGCRSSVAGRQRASPRRGLLGTLDIRSPPRAALRAAHARSCRAHAPIGARFGGSIRIRPRRRCRLGAAQSLPGAPAVQAGRRRGHAGQHADNSAQRADESCRVAPARLRRSGAAHVRHGSILSMASGYHWAPGTGPLGSSRRQAWSAQI